MAGRDTETQRRRATTKDIDAHADTNTDALSGFRVDARAYITWKQRSVEQEKETRKVTMSSAERTVLRIYEGPVASYEFPLRFDRRESWRSSCRTARTAPVSQPRILECKLKYGWHHSCV